MFNRSHRGAFAKFKSGTAPIAIETGRYKGLNVMERKCFNCQESVADEVHVLLHCPQYTSLRNELFSKAGDIRNDFYSLDDNEKISFILSDPSIVKESAKTCYMILNKRRSLLYIWYRYVHRVFLALYSFIFRYFVLIHTLVLNNTKMCHVRSVTMSGLAVSQFCRWCLVWSPDLGYDVWILVRHMFSWSGTRHWASMRGRADMGQEQTDVF